MDEYDTVAAGQRHAYFTRMAKRRPPVEPGFVAALRRHGQVVDAETADAPLPEGVTHVIVKGKLIEKRKSAF